jgi:hypothetical protein
MPYIPGDYRVTYDGKETVAHFNGKTWLLCGCADPFKEKDFESIGERIPTNGDIKNMREAYIKGREDFLDDLVRATI